MHPDLMFLNGFEQAQQIVYDLKVKALRNEFAWQKLHKAEKYLQGEQVKLGEHYFTEETEVAQ